MIFRSESLHFIGYFFRAYPARSAVMVLLLIVAGLAEGIGLVALLPLLEFATGQGEATSALTQSVVTGFEALGIAPGLGSLLVLIVLMISLKALFVWMAMKQVGYTVARVLTDLRLRLIRAVLKARWRFFVQKPTGHFANAISSEASRSSSGYQYACQGISGLIQMLVYLGVVLVISWEVAVVALIVGPFITYALRGFVAMSREAGSERTNLMRELIGRVTEVLPGIKAIKAMAREHTVLPLLERETEDLNRAQERSILASTSLRAFQEPVIVLVLATGLYAAVTWGDAEGAAVLVAAVLFYRVMTTASNLQTQYQQIVDKESAFSSLMETLDEAESAAEDDPPGAKSAGGLRKAIVLEDVWFSYDQEPVLRGVDLTLYAGEVVSFMGDSGAGKTTLIDLITGLMQPTHGRIVVDGVPLAEIDRSTWRGQIGYVPQEMLLFHDTIFRNVTLGDERFDRSDVEWALKAAGAWDFVGTHEHGMERIVGERGAQISGGQRQRIGLARAIVARPRLLILDEATTALDPETEAQVCDTLTTLKGDTTIIAISHQPAIRRVSDRIFQVAGGQVQPSASPGAAVGGA